MTPDIVLYAQFDMSLLTFALIAWWYLVPYWRTRPFADAVRPILLLHTVRHLGLMYLSPAAVSPGPPEGFVQPTAYGDLATAAMAFVALLVLRFGERPAKAAVWIFNLVGFADLALAIVNARRFELVTHHIGVAYLLPALVVPALLVSHGVVFWLLLRREPVAAD